MKHIYWGLGKGKTSSLNGSAVRAKGANLRVAVFRFLKGRESSENAALEKFGIKVSLCQESKKFVLQMEPEEKIKEKENTMNFMKYIKMNLDKYDVIILDEILDLCADNVNFLTEDQLVDYIESLGSKEILMSGHTKLDKLFEKADLITEFLPTKHYFERGVTARKGIEF